MNDEETSDEDSFELLEQANYKIYHIRCELIGNTDSTDRKEHWLHYRTECIDEYLKLFRIHVLKWAGVADNITDGWKLVCHCLLDVS
jgi:hypothetical protein